MLWLCRWCVSIAVGFLVGNAVKDDYKKKRTPNVLFIMSEDLRPELPSFGRSLVKAPNIQRIADKGLIFDLTTCQVAICAPSRSSMLTGLRPDRLGIYDFFHHGGVKFFRTIPSHFHRNGYQTAMAGKLFHWESNWHYSYDYWGSPMWENMHKREMDGFMNSSVTPDAIHDEEKGFFRDSEIANAAVRFLKGLNQRPEPWFLGVGFKGTHMQYQMPHRFWKQYAHITADMVNISAEHLRFPPSAPLLHHLKKTEGSNIVYMKDEGKSKGVEVENYQSKGYGRTISLRGFEELYRGYLGCLSYADDQLGKVLDVMDELKLWDNTVVVFTSDHGMHLGEKGIWGKWTLYDEATRVPLIVHDPASPQSFGKHYRFPVELIDIFPTLVDLTGVPLESPCPYAPILDKKGPRNPMKGEAEVVGKWKHIFRHSHCFDLDGTSLAPAFWLGESFRKDRDFAITQRLTCKFRSRDNDPYTPEWIDFCPFKKVPRDPPFGAMGYAVRSNDWRYIAWLEFNTHSFLPSLNLPPLAEELYDHRGEDASIGSGEINNLAYNNEYSHILLELKVRLYDHLWYNASFEHLFQKYAANSDMRAIVAGRIPVTQQPHHQLYPNHFYSHHSKASVDKVNRGVAAGIDGFLSSIQHNPRLGDHSNGIFRTSSGLINMTIRGEVELASMNSMIAGNMKNSFEKEYGDDGGNIYGLPKGVNRGQHKKGPSKRGANYVNRGSTDKDENTNNN